MNPNLTYCACGDPVPKRVFAIQQKLPMNEAGLPTYPRCGWCLRAVALAIKRYEKGLPPRNKQRKVGFQFTRAQMDRNAKILSMAASGISQSDIARTLEMSKAQISKIVNGRRGYKNEKTTT